jgi:SAM-dependent methyltransferase
VISAYDDTVAAGWAGGAGVVYGPLAEALLAACPVPLGGARVLDAGSGTGAVAMLAAAAGATVTAADLSRSMLAARGTKRWPAVVADVLALPFFEKAFDVAVAAFLINHLDPEVALRSLRRAVRPGGAVVASTWAMGADSVKTAVDAVLAAYGWRPPAWYQAMKSVLDPVSGDPGRLAEAARHAGLVDVAVWVHAESLGVHDPRAVVAYRLATPQVAWWAESLDDAARRRVVDAAASAVAPRLAQWRPAAVFVRGRSPGQPTPRLSAARSSVSR